MNAEILPAVDCQYIGYSEVTGLFVYRYRNLWLVMDLTADLTGKPGLVRTKII